MGVRRTWLGVSLLAALLCCARPAEPRTSRPPRGAAREPASDDLPGLEEIADAIDPGPRPGLTHELPGWLGALLRDEPRLRDVGELLAAADAELQSFEAQVEAGVDDDAMPSVLLSLGRALAMSEEAAAELADAPVEALVRLERVYNLMDAPQLANDRGLVSRLVQAMGAAAAQEGDVEAEAAMNDLTQLAFASLRGSGALHRHTVATLLRRAPEHPAVPDALAHLAGGAWREDEALAVAIMRRSLEQRGDDVAAEHWLDLAVLCHRTLDLACGQQARAKALALLSADDEALRERLKRAGELADSARKAVELADAAGLEDGLERGEALVDLERYADADALYEQLHRRHPEDARPVFGQARVMLFKGFDFVGAYELIKEANPAEHRGQRWYELTIGVRATAVLYYMMPQLAGQEPQAAQNACQ